MVGVFNRSHYEDVLVARVEPRPQPVWRMRYGAIRDFERLLAQSGVEVLKFFLHISPESSASASRDRLADPTEHWKFRAGDLERANAGTVHVRVRGGVRRVLDRPGPLVRRAGG